MNNGALTSRILQDGAAAGRRRSTLDTGGQASVSRGTMGSKSYTTKHNQTNTQLLKNAMECRRSHRKENRITVYTEERKQ